METNNRIDLKLIGVPSGIFLLLTFLLVNTIGIIAGAITFSAMNDHESKKEIWIFGIIVALYGVLSDFTRNSMLVDSRSLSISILSGVFMGLIAVGVTRFAIFIKAKLNK